MRRLRPDREHPRVASSSVQLLLQLSDALVVTGLDLGRPLRRTVRRASREAAAAADW